MLNRKLTTSIVSVVAAFVLPFFLSGFAIAQTDYIWSGGNMQSDSWSEPENWQNGEVPTSEDATRLIFPSDSLSFTSTNDLGDFILQAMNIDTGDEGYLIQGGQLIFNTGLGVFIDGNADGNITNDLFLNGGSGLTSFNTGATIFDGMVDVNDGFLSGVMSLNSNLNVSGATRVSANSFIDANATTTVTSGEFKIEAGAELRGQSDLFVNAGAFIDLQTGTVIKNVNIADGGAISGNGTVLGNLLVDGVITPGNSAGTLDIDGDVDMSDTTMTCIELGGTGINDYDLINGAVSVGPGNTAFLDGILEVSLIDGFMPTEFDEFMFIQGFDIVGTFDNTGDGTNFTGMTDGSLNIAGGSFQVEYGSNFVRLHSFQAIPEPGMAIVLGVGTLGLMLRRRRT